MALIGINMPSNPDRKPSTLEKIALGTKIATDILGTGNDIYKTVNPPKKDPDPLLDALKLQMMQNSLGSSVLTQKKAAMDISKAEDEKRFGKQISETYVNKLSEAAILPEELKNISSSVDDQSDLFDPIKGRARALNPYDDEAQLLQSKLKTTAQQVGKFLEDGVLRKEDEIKYEKMLPQIGDTPEVAKGKSAIVFEKLKKRFVQLRQNLDKSKYDTRAFDGHPLDTMKIEEIVSGAKDAAGSVAPGFKAGDTKVINGTPYVRDQNGNWSPK